MLLSVGSNLDCNNAAFEHVATRSMNIAHAKMDPDFLSRNAVAMFTERSFVAQSSSSCGKSGIEVTELMGNPFVGSAVPRNTYVESPCWAELTASPKVIATSLIHFQLSFDEIHPNGQPTCPPAFVSRIITFPEPLLERLEGCMKPSF